MAQEEENFGGLLTPRELKAQQQLLARHSVSEVGGQEENASESAAAPKDQSSKTKPKRSALDDSSSDDDRGEVPFLPCVFLSTVTASSHLLSSLLFSSLLPLRRELIMAPLTKIPAT